MNNTQIGNEYKATVVISTINRKADLRRALRSVEMQNLPLETIVIDDGSTDDTYEMVSREFPQVRLYRSEMSKGLTVQRNNAARYATTNIIISIDDDAEFSSPNVVAQTLREFDHPGVGAIFIPVIDTYRKKEYGLHLPNNRDIFVDQQFAGTAYALRVDIFKKLDGFREFLWGWGEEDDYCLRLLDAGYFVRCGRADHIYHHVSPSRNLARIAYYSSRNSIIYTYANVPMPYFMIHLVGTTLINFYSSLKRGFIVPTIKGLIRGYIDALVGPIKRAPVHIKVYKLSRKMRKDGVLTLSKAQELLITS
jgi:GT2 family glycosyltransferase